jgi:hypothetical protein
MEGELLITFAVHKGSQYRVNNVEISGGASLPLPDLRASLRTRVAEPYSDANLDADVTAIESVYHGRGFAAAKVQADPRPGAATSDGTQIPVAVSILITEGVRTVVGTVRIEGNESVSESALREILSLQPGTPYFDAQLRRDTDAIQLEYANLGYRSATVQAQPGFTADRAQANLVFTVREGPRIFVDHVLIAGNVRTSAQTIERELQLKAGDPLSLEAEYESQRRLAALQLFRRATTHGAAPRRRDAARSARDGRGSGADDARIRRRPRRAVASRAPRGGGRFRPAEVRPRASSVRRFGTPEPLRQESIDQFFRERQPAPSRFLVELTPRLRIHGVPRIYHLPRAAAPLHRRRRRPERHSGAADSIELQLLAPERDGPGVPAIDPQLQHERLLSVNTRLLDDLVLTISR